MRSEVHNWDDSSVRKLRKGGRKERSLTAWRRRRGGFSDRFGIWIGISSERSDFEGGAQSRRHLQLLHGAVSMRPLISSQWQKSLLILVQCIHIQWESFLEPWTWNDEMVSKRHVLYIFVLWHHKPDSTTSNFQNARVGNRLLSF